MTSVPAQSLEELFEVAWAVREHAHILGETKVGSAVLSQEGTIHVGCNVEHPFRSHDMHAEVNAIGSMVAGGGSRAVAIVIVAERERFTPCGACMDWIMLFGGPTCTVAFQGGRGGKHQAYTASELMPFYPK